MSITFSLPQPIEDDLRAQLVNLDEAAKEAALVELYRLGNLSHGQLAESLGISRDQTNAVLQRHRVTEDLLTSDELDAQRANIRRLSKK